jgi:DNA processing protein
MGADWPSLGHVTWTTPSSTTPWPLADSLLGQGERLFRAAPKGSIRPPCVARWEAGGKVCGVLADSLEKTTMNREHRNLLLDGQLVLISPYDPSAGFNVGNAMQRNKLIYALADASLVVSSDLNKGGTWTGAVEQLDKLKFVPVFMSIDGRVFRRIGWFAQERRTSLAEPARQRFVRGGVQGGHADADGTGWFFAVFERRVIAGRRNIQRHPYHAKPLPRARSSSEPSAPVDAVADTPPPVTASEALPPVTPEAAAPIDEAKESPRPESTLAEALFAVVRTAIQQILSAPMKDAEVAAALDVSNMQAKAWLQRLVDEGVLEKLKKPAGYVLKQKRLFE